MKRKSTVIKRRRRDMSKTHEPPMQEIPFELVIEILTRLPAKSLMKFKSVSKLWSSLICSRYFTNRFQRVASSPPRLYMVLHFVDNSHQKSMVLSASPSSDSDGNTLSSFDVYQDLTIPARRGCYASNVFRGLMCFIIGSSAQIYNTTTRQLVVLPDIQESKLIPEDHKSMWITCHVGHDPVHDQYKVVCIASRLNRDEDAILSEHWVFLLEGDGSSRWKKISCGSRPHRPLTNALNINGRMHYIAAVSMVDTLIMTFNIHSEEFSVLQLPKDTFWADVDLIEYGGKIALLRYPNIESRIHGVLQVWVMKDEERNMWEHKILVLHPSQKHMVSDMSLKVQGTTLNGEIILVPRFTESLYILLYDLQKNHMRKIEIKATPNRHLTKSCEVVGMDDVENLIYL